MKIFNTPFRFRSNGVWLRQLKALKNIDFFGYQLLEFLLDSTTKNKINQNIIDKQPDRIIRAKEVQHMTCS